MKFSLSWLTAHLKTDLPLDAIVQRLTEIGLEVEEVQDRRQALAPFVAGKVVACQPHPNADRLRVCEVDDGNRRWPVVCGAPNAHEGMIGVFAPAGTVIPVTGATLKGAKIRGEDSQGMLCSSYELGLDENHDSIIELAADTPIGASYSALVGLDDPVITIGLTPDRGDCAGVRGIARDLAAAGCGEVMPLAAPQFTKDAASSVSVTLDFCDVTPSPCSLFALRCVRGVRNGSSPQEVTNRLRAAGLRPLSALVDVTNFFTLDRARPLHVFDADKVRGNLHLRLSQAGESFEGLDGKTYTLTDGMTVICDDNGIISLGGIMGGMSTRCDENTTNVLVEAAVFDAKRTAMTGRKLALMSDARYRFERGIDDAAAVDGLNHACAMIVDLCGGQVEEVFVTGAVAVAAPKIDMPADAVERLSGVSLPIERQGDILSRLGFAVEAYGEAHKGGLRATPPSWRHDVEQTADLIEEVLRIHGYDAIAAQPVITMKRARHEEDATRDYRLRRALASRGLCEAVSYSFMDESLAKHFAPPVSSLRLANPLTTDMSYMRPTAAANLLTACARNLARGVKEIALFELGPAYNGRGINDQSHQAVVVRCGQMVGRNWLSPAREADIFDAKADALAGLQACGVGIDSLTPCAIDVPWYHPGQCGGLAQGRKVLARFGMVHPAVAQACGLSASAAVCEVLLDALSSRAGRRFGTYRLASLQPVERDYAFVLDEKTPVEDLVRCVRAAVKPSKTLRIERVEVFDIYSGAPLAVGQKSVALVVVYQPLEETLTESQLDDFATAIAQRADQEMAARLRDGHEGLTGENKVVTSKS